MSSDAAVIVQGFGGSDGPQRDCGSEGVSIHSHVDGSGMLTVSGTTDSSGTQDTITHYALVSQGSFP